MDRRLIPDPASTLAGIMRRLDVLERVGPASTVAALTVTGTLTAGTVNATTLSGALAATNLTGTIDTGRLTGAYTGITSVGTLGSLAVTGTVTAGTFSGSGASLTSIPAGQLTGNIASARLSGAYTGITGLGDLTSDLTIRKTTAKAMLIGSGNPGIEIRSSDAAGTPYLDFTRGSTADNTPDYTARVILNSAGDLEVQGVQLVLPLGSISAPSLTFTGDTNTGIYRGDVDRIDIVAGGVYCAAGITAAGVGTFYTASPSTSVTTTWRHSGFGAHAIPSSSLARKRDIVDLDGDEALDVLGRVRPVSFLWRPFPSDDETVASLRDVDRQVGFIAEWMADVDAPWELAEYQPPAIPDGATPEEAEALIRDLSQWTPSYWKEPHLIALLTAAVRRLAARVSTLEENQ